MTFDHIAAAFLLGVALTVIVQIFVDAYRTKGKE